MLWLSKAITSAKEFFFSMWELLGLSWPTAIWGGFGMLFVILAGKVVSACWKFWSILCSLRRNDSFRISTFKHHDSEVLDQQFSTYFLTMGWLKQLCHSSQGNITRYLEHSRHIWGTRDRRLCLWLGLSGNCSETTFNTSTVLLYAVQHTFDKS